MSLPKIGQVAPSFTLLNQDGEKVSLKQFKGHKNVALYFYPRAMTPGCNVQARGMKEAQSQLEKIDTVTLGVSPDAPDRLTRFKEKENLNFALLSDLDHKIAEKYGVWAPKKFMGREFLGVVRTTFLIGKDGRIKHILEKVKTKTHHSEVYDWIKKNL